MGYRGEIMVSFKNRYYDKETMLQLFKPYEVGNKVAQLIIIPYPKVHLIEVDELSNSDRGKCGHGSTGS